MERNNHDNRGQSSIEALMAFCALLLALSFLASAARDIGARLYSSSMHSADEYSLSYAALSLDSMPPYAYSGRGRSIAASGGSIYLPRSGASQPGFYNVSSDGRGLNVQKELPEPG